MLHGMKGLFYEIIFQTVIVACYNISRNYIKHLSIDRSLIIKKVNHKFVNNSLEDFYKE